MEPEGSLPHSQVSATCPYPEPAQSSPYPHIPFPEDPSYYHPPICVWVFQVVSFPQVSPRKSCIHLSSLPYALHAPPITLDFVNRTISGDISRHTTEKVQKACEFKRCFYCLFSAQQPPPHQWAMASSFTRFLHHTQRRTTVGRTPLDEWWIRHRDLYLTTHNIHNR